MSGMYLLATILCLTIGSGLGDIIEGNYNVTSYCTLVPTGTQLGSIVSCNYYYVCTSTGPQQAYCQSGYLYNAKAGTCSPADQVNCYYGVENACQGTTDDKWVPVVGTCNQWIYCQGGKKQGSGSCGKFSFIENSQKCDYPLCNNVGLLDGPNLVNPCDVVPAGKYFGSTTDCATYNYCYPDGQLATAKCKTNAFILSTGSCGYNTGSVCDRVVSNTGSTGNACNSQGSMEGDPDVCSNYYYCDGKTFSQKSCPTGQYFDTESKSCKNRQAATPVKTCNRCQFASSPFVNAVNTQYCNTYYYCSNGTPDKTNTCPYQTFFNEALQGCDSTTNLPAYVNNNGACLGATEQPQTTAAPTSSTASETTSSDTTSNTTPTTAGNENTGE